MSDKIGVVLRLYIDEDFPIRKMQIVRPYLNSKCNETAKDCVTDLEYYLSSVGSYSASGDENININGKNCRAIVTTYSLKYMDSKHIESIMDHAKNNDINFDMYFSNPASDYIKKETYYCEKHSNISKSVKSKNDKKIKREYNAKFNFLNCLSLMD